MSLVNHHPPVAIVIFSSGVLQDGLRVPMMDDRLRGEDHFVTLACQSERQLCIFSAQEILSEAPGLQKDVLSVACCSCIDKIYLGMLCDVPITIVIFQLDESWNRGGLTSTNHPANPYNLLVGKGRGHSLDPIGLWDTINIGKEKDFALSSLGPQVSSCRRTSPELR